MILKLLITFILPQLVVCFSAPELVIYPVKVFLPQDYQAAYDEVYVDIKNQIHLIAEEMSIRINTSNVATQEKIMIQFKIEFADSENSFTQKEASPAVCDELDGQGIRKLLGKMNEKYNKDNTIIFVPCVGIFTPLFKQLGLEIPMHTVKYNTKCNVHAAIPYAETPVTLRAMLGPALMQMLNAPSDTRVAVQEKNLGNKGIVRALSIDETAIKSVLLSACFNKRRKEGPTAK